MNFNITDNSKHHLISLSTRYNKPLKHKKILKSLNENITKAEVDIMFSELNEKLQSSSMVSKKNQEINLKLNKDINYKTDEELEGVSIGVEYFYKLKELVENNNKKESIKLINRISNGKWIYKKDIEKIDSKEKQFEKIMSTAKRWLNEL